MVAYHPLQRWPSSLALAAGAGAIFLVALFGGLLWHQGAIPGDGDASAVLQGGTADSSLVSHLEAHPHAFEAPPVRTCR